jgi:hypothetical protein
VISVAHFVTSEADFATRGGRALDALGAQAGFLRGSLARSADDETHWVLVTEWANVGSYRRALGGYEVKLHATPVLAEAIDLPSSFEPLVVVSGGTTVVRPSDREPTP